MNYSRFLVLMIGIILQGCAVFEHGQSPLAGVQLIEPPPANATVHVRYRVDHVAAAGTAPSDVDHAAAGRYRVGRALAAAGLTVAGDSVEADYILEVRELLNTDAPGQYYLTIPLWMFSAGVLPLIVPESSNFEYQLVHKGNVEASTVNASGSRVVSSWLMLPFMFNLKTANDFKEKAHHEAIIDLLNQGAFAP